MLESTLARQIIAFLMDVVASGGFPVVIDGECLGAVGVSGLTPEDDEALVQEVIGIIVCIHYSSP